MNEWTALVSGLSLLTGAALGVLLFAAWMRHKVSVRMRLPARWPLRLRRLVNSNELQVWNWLGSSFPDHRVMVKVPILRFTVQHGTEKFNAGVSARDKAHARVESERWLELLNGIYTTFTVCTTDGKVVGCVDVSGKPVLTKANRELKETLFLDCGIGYTVVDALNLPDASRMRTSFLGEMPVKTVEHQVTRGGDSDFHADLSAFTKQQAKIAN